MTCKNQWCFLAVGALLWSLSCSHGASDNENYPVLPTKIMPDFTPHFREMFNDAQEFKENWIKSEAKKDGVDSDISRYDGDWELDYPKKLPIDGDTSLTFKQKAKHRAISTKLNHPFRFTNKPLFLQYEVLFQDNQECGGAYLKLLSEGSEGNNLKLFHDKTPYTIMFGPDKCGNNNFLRFIFRHRNPINGSFEEKHSKGPSKRIDELFSDGVSHLYTLIVRPDNSYQILVDHEIVISGSLLEDVSPPVNPPKEIDDPTDHKPADWDDREKIPDDTATKPDDWDDSAPSLIPDPNAVKPDNWLENEPIDILDPSAEKPEDWDDAMDGAWEAPMLPNPACEEAAGCGPWSPPKIDNPAYKGKWSPPMVDNPAYKGKWKPKQIPNPDFFEDKNPFAMAPVASLGFELWSMSANIFFDNIVITDSEEYLKEWTEATYTKKTSINNKNAGSLISRFIEFTNENPWLWAVYTLLPLIPMALITYLCLQPKDQGDHSSDAADKGDKDSDNLGTVDNNFVDEEVEQEEDEDEDRSTSEDRERSASQLENEVNESKDGVRQRFSSPGPSLEEENLANEKRDDQVSSFARAKGD